MSNAETYKAAYILAETDRWSSWEYRKNEVVTVENLGTVTVVSTIEDHRRTARGYWDDYIPQGSVAPAGIVFEVIYPDGTIRYFQKDGMYDSYGDVSYEGGSFFEVEPATKSTIEFVRV